MFVRKLCSYDLGRVNSSQLHQNKITMFNGTDDKEFSTRVNSARLADYVSKHVRLPCKVLKVSRISLISDARLLLTQRVFYVFLARWGAYNGGGERWGTGHCQYFICA